MYNYYSIGSSIETSVIGKYPQTKMDDNFFAFNWPPLDQYFRVDKFIPFELECKILFNNKAKITDILQNLSIPWGLVVNERTKLILEQFHLPPHRFYALKAVHKEQELNYYWFHFYDDISQYIDYKQSKFHILNQRKMEIIDTLTGKALEELDTFQNQNRLVECLTVKELRFKDTFPKYDVFPNTIPILGVGGHTVVSERLIKVFEQEKVTGISYGLFFTANS